MAQATARQKKPISWNPINWAVYGIQFLIQAPDRSVQNIVQQAALARGATAFLFFIIGIGGAIASFHVFLSTDIGLQIKTYESYDMEIILALSLAICINAIQLITAFTMRRSLGIFLVWAVMTGINTVSNMAEIPTFIPTIANDGNAILFFAFLSASVAQIMVVVFLALLVNTAVHAAASIGGFFGFLANLGNILNHGYTNAGETPDEHYRRVIREIGSEEGR